MTLTEFKKAMDSQLDKSYKEISKSGKLTNYKLKESKELNEESKQSI